MGETSTEYTYVETPTSTVGICEFRSQSRVWVETYAPRVALMEADVE